MVGNTMDWRGKTILLTGGTGSFGTAFTRFVLGTLPIHSLRVFSRDELKQWEMQKKFGDDRLRFLIGDVRDRDRLYRALDGVDVVVHAAALKQVPLCEYNPIEAIKTNILGAANIVDAAIDRGVDRVMALSTDKAASPTNLYGATKLCAEKLFTHANSYVGAGRTRFACCRYGNVLGSRGSVVPLFLAQRSAGVLGITDARMSRFWVTLPRAAEFVTQRLEAFEGGEIFVPKLPSVNILELAKAIAPEAQVQIVGMRPGEKLSEVLVTEHESRFTRDMGAFFTIMSEHGEWPHADAPTGAGLADGFEYRSDNNHDWLTSEQIRLLLSEQGLSGVIPDQLIAVAQPLEVSVC
jgi:UDP-N-acetylglucosamine 4,6-dehydratase